MLQFIIGVLVGGTFGFAICAICTMAGNRSYTDERNQPSETENKES